MKNILLLVPMFLFLMGCTKSLELDIIESRCKDFSLNTATIDFEQPNCPGNISGNTLNINFNTTGANECVVSLHRTVVFYDEQNNELATVSQDPDSVNVADSSFFVGSNSASFTFSFEMSSPVEYDKISYVTVNFYTQNETFNQSNKLAILQPLPCKDLPDPTQFERTLIVRNSNVSVTLTDDAAEDGDIITIIINNQIRQSNVFIRNDPQTFNFTIDPSTKNHISFYAVNEGTSSPNTVSGTIDDGFSSQSFDVNMREGETISFDLVYQGF